METVSGGERDREMYGEKREIEAVNLFPRPAAPGGNALAGGLPQMLNPSPGPDVISMLSFTDSLIC